MKAKVEKLIGLMREAGLYYIRDLAEAASISPSGAGKVVRGMNVNDDTMRKVAKSVGVKLADIVVLDAEGRVVE